MKAVIDLGTNTFHLLIGETKNGKINEFFKLQVPVKIGKGGINDGVISDDAFTRGLTTIGEFKKYLDQFSVTDVFACATSAIRNAKNGNEFVKKVSDLYQIQIITLSGDQEAVSIYEGVRHSFKLKDENLLVMDIGGGSVEFIIGQTESVLWKQSIEIGAARLSEKFHKHEPIKENEIKSLNDYLSTKLSSLKEALTKFPSEILVGSAGSFETLLDIVIKDLAVVPNSLSKNAYEIRREDFDVFYELMIQSDELKRAKLRGMVDFRVEMIVVSAVLMRYVIEEFQIKKIIASDFSLKEGMMFRGNL
jgi:exopolyphosphatase / guanosine-5'-triphosphate,3'-diphosphate pyrophosphatase